MEEVYKIIKGGEAGVNLSIKKSPLGLTIGVKVHPVVEEFMYHLGEGQVVPVVTVGRLWFPVDNQGREDKKAKALEAHGLQVKLDPISTDQGSPIEIERLGQGLIMGNVHNGDIERINLSFLRLIGASLGEGVRFGLRGVYSEEATLGLRNKLATGVKKFYISYLRPIDLYVSIVLQGN